MTIVRRLALPAALLGAATAAAVLAGTQISAAVRRAAAEPGALVEPAPLSRHHAAVPELADCDACHALTTRPPDAKCLACHVEVAADRARPGGWHATLDAPCADCHADHRGAGLAPVDRAEFNHARARFPLRGAHLRTECEACHAAPAKAGGERLAFFTVHAGADLARCETCHADPHREPLAADCTRCHSEDGWTGRELRFTHERDTEFPLRGAHAAAGCADCHVPPAGATLAAAEFRGLGTDCTACHADPHEGGLDGACAQCHSENAWTGLDVRFRHADVFPLTGRHAAAPCVGCHSPPDGRSLAAARLRGTPRDCAGCHDDPHAPSLGIDCARCHGTEGWTGKELRLDHGGFPLRGSHAALPCAACHVPPNGEAGRPLPLAAARFLDTPRDCGGCHEDPHRGSLAPRPCADCHDERAFRETRFDHARDARYAPDLRHARLDCSACHAGAVFRPVATDCAGCHADVADVTAGRGELAVLLPGAEADPHSGKVGCGKCHDTTRERPSAAEMAARCTACHASTYAALHLERTHRLASLLLAARGGADEARLDALRRAAAHDFVPVERALRSLGRPLEPGRDRGASRRTADFPGEGRPGR